MQEYNHGALACDFSRQEPPTLTEPNIRSEPRVHLVHFPLTPHDFVENSMTGKYIVVHGGAGYHSEASESSVKRALRRCVVSSNNSQ